MGYEIRVDERREIVEIRLFQEMAGSAHLRAKGEVLERCRACGIRKILVDAADLTGRPPTTMDLFEFGAGWADIAKQGAVVLAGVPPTDAGARGWWKFGETVAINRGLVTRAFDKVENARAWLETA